MLNVYLLKTILNFGLVVVLKNINKTFRHSFIKRLFKSFVVFEQLLANQSLYRVVIRHCIDIQIAQFKLSKHVVLLGNITSVFIGKSSCYYIDKCGSRVLKALVIQRNGNSCNLLRLSFKENIHWKTIKIENSQSTKLIIETNLSL